MMPKSQPALGIGIIIAEAGAKENNGGSSRWSPVENRPKSASSE
jgi:hypothetical protein